MSSEDKPRWTVTITPSAGLEANISLTTHAGDVTAGEVAYVLQKAALAFSAPQVVGQRLPTEAEVSEQRRLSFIRQEHPVQRMLVLDGKQLWLGQEALDRYLAQLTERGWQDMGPVPEGTSGICTYQKLGEADFTAHYLPSPEVEN